MSAPLLIELLVEELPAGMCRPALEGLRRGVLSLLEGLAHDTVQTFATPRRLAIAIDGLPAARPSTEVEVTGPPAQRAFDAYGRPTKVAEGFARGRGVAVEDLYTVELPKRGLVVAAKVQEGGERVVDLLADGLADVIARIPFGKTMTWGDGGGLAFGRPLRGVLCVYDGAVVPGEAHGLPFTGHTTGHRLFPEAIEPKDGASYLHGLRAHFVEPDVDVRAGRIRSLLDEAADELGADRIVDPDLSEEVLWLVEWPVLVLGRFDDELLALPPKLLITSMKEHQRYFPVHRDGALTEHFVVIGNNPEADVAVVSEGNARVLRARFHDARFFLAEDRRVGLATYQAKLDGMRWIRGLGTMADKAARLEASSRAMAAVFGADADAAAWAGRWSKADLASQMVGEFPKLQGHMGRVYAQEVEGVPDRAPTAIEAHYQPAFTGDALPGTPEGAAVALADRLDTLVGCFGVGLQPGSGGDPQGLRRAANGVVALLLGFGVRRPLGRLLDEVGDGFAGFVHSLGDAGDVRFDRWHQGEAQRAERLGALGPFVLARYRAMAAEQGAGADVVDAVLATAPGLDALDLVLVDRIVRSLAERAGSEEFEQLLQLAKRVSNIAGEAGPSKAGPEAHPEGAERALVEAVDALAGSLDRSLDVGDPDVDGAIDAVLAIRPKVATFFDEILVNDPDDVDGTARRLALLARLRQVMGRLADFSRISTR